MSTVNTSCLSYSSGWSQTNDPPGLPFQALHPWVYVPYLAFLSFTFFSCFILNRGSEKWNQLAMQPALLGPELMTCLPLPLKLCVHHGWLSFSSETGSLYVDQAGLKLRPDCVYLQKLELKVCTATRILFSFDGRDFVFKTQASFKRACSTFSVRCSLEASG